MVRDVGLPPRHPRHGIRSGSKERGRYIVSNDDFAWKCALMRGLEAHVPTEAATIFPLLGNYPILY